MYMYAYIYIYVYILYNHIMIQIINVGYWHRYWKWAYLKGVTMSKPSFWVSVLVFGTVNHFKQFQFWIFLHPSRTSRTYSSQAHPRTYQGSALAFNKSRSASNDGSLADAAFTAQCNAVCWCGSTTLGIARSSKSCCNTARWRHPAATCLRNKVQRACLGFLEQRQQI